MINIFWAMVTILVFKEAYSNKIEVGGGLIKVNHSNCTVTVNGEKKDIVDGVVPGLQFGIVSYVCDGDIGTVISKLACHKCGLFCAANEMIDGCQNVLLPLLIGLLLGFISGSVVIALFWSLIMRAFVALLEWFNEKRQIRSDRSHKVKVDKLNRLTNSNNPYNFTNDYHLNTAGYMRVLNLRRLMVAGVTAAILLTNGQECEAHDKTLFMHSTGRICEDMKCTDSDMINFNLVTGNVLLLEDDSGKKIELSISQTYYRHRYTYTYDTSDYDIDVKSEYRCKAPGGYCWEGKCNPDSKFQLFGNDDHQVKRYGCNVDTIGCDTWCYNQISCTWFVAKLNPIGHLYSVYEYQSRIWEVVVDVVRDGYRTRNIINANNPILNIDNIGRSNGSFPMLVNSFLSEDYLPSRFGLEMGDSLHIVDACRVNFPMLDRIGDLQIDKHGNMTFPIDRLDCSSSSCKAYCKLMDSPIRRFNNWKVNSIPKKIYKVVNSNIVETREQTQSSINFMIQLNGFRQLDYSPANCVFEIVSKFACNACNEKPFVIFQPSRIVHKGMLEVVSNCTLEMNYIPCTGEPIRIRLQEMPTSCEITVIRTNQSIRVDFEYVYLGGVDSMRSHVIYSTVDELTSMITSESFIYGLLSSASTIFGVGIVASLILRIVYIVEANRAVRDINKK